MAPNNTIKARIALDEKEFSRGLSRARSSLAGFSKGFGALLGGAAGAIGIRELDQLATAAVKMGDEIGKAAKTAGIGADALQEYRHAAELAGNTQKQFDDAVARFNRRLGEGRNGNKAYADTFRQIGVTATDTNEKALAKTFDHLAAIKDEARRTSVATKVFGDDARRMALLVKDGAGALAAARKEARDLGLVIGGDLVAKAEKAQDRLTILENQLKNRTAVAVLENVEGFTAFKTLLNDIAIASVKAAAGIGKAAAGIEALTDAQLDAAIAAAEARGPRDFAIGGGGSTDRLANEERLRRLRAERVRRASSVTVGDIAGAVGPGAAPPALDPEFVFRGKTPGVPTLKSDALFKASEKAQDEIARLIDQTRTPLEKLHVQMQEIRDLKPFAETPEQLAALDAALAATQLQIEGLKNKTVEWREASIAAGRGIADAFAGAIVYGESLGKTLKNLIKQLAFKGLSNLLFSAASRFIPGGSALSSVFGGFRAAGGPVSPGRAYMVGERGPELFTPNVAGQIAPNGAALGGAVIHQTLRFDVALESVQQMIASATPPIAAATVEAIEKARRRSAYA